MKTERFSQPAHNPSVFTRLRRESRQELKYTEITLKSEDSEGGHWKSKLRRKKSSVEDDDLSQPWTESHENSYKCIEESGNVKGAPECMRISGFVHGITNPELIKRFHEKIPKTVDEMMQVATSFLQGQEAASNQERKKVPPAWRHQEGGHSRISKKGEASAANISKKKGRTDSLFSQKPRRRFWP
ncbi:hypothetical protein Tco_1082468 [Tanacetum coccineum]|uniref:Reverse transcriptase domain-containing protein n=1 Tax=Tanacetum coccineum TaxID=301880 RepID=A0ABQ5I2L1_9ASTR